MLMAIMLGIAVFLLFLPACFVAGTGRNEHTVLVERIEIEQQDHYKASFMKKRPHWPGLSRLRHDQALAQRLSEYLGLDRRKLAASLTRLRWEISLEEIILARIAACCFLLAALVYAVLVVRTSGGIQMVQLTPVLLASLLFFLPTFLLESADKRAIEEIREQVPILFGIVLALVEAGLPIHTAIRSAARRYDGRLGRELALLEVEEKRYGNWRKALEEMAYRWEVDALVSIALEINGALTKGVSIAGPLATQVEELLKQQEDEAADRVNRLSVRLLPLLILFMGVPLLFLVIGPAFIGIGRAL
jgi:tight adherence protein C